VRLAEDLLVLARMERNRVPVDRKEVSISDLMRQVVPPYGERARRVGARIELDVEPATVLVDPARIRQALENLLDNALRFTGPGGVITLRSGRTGDVAWIRVEDTGPGFSQALLESVFEPFVRSETEVVGNGSGVGAGLGLAIVRAVAEAHGGTASAENLPTGGARVTLLLRT
ncbi:MAG TPA: HAMP domain-containing sensor histidine kinase, partial [Actinomycetota bacterium]